MPQLGATEEYIFFGEIHICKNLLQPKLAASYTHYPYQVGTPPTDSLALPQLGATSLNFGETICTLVTRHIETGIQTVAQKFRWLPLPHLPWQPTCRIYAAEGLHPLVVALALLHQPQPAPSVCLDNASDLCQAFRVILYLLHHMGIGFC